MYDKPPPKYDKPPPIHDKPPPPAAAARDSGKLKKLKLKKLYNILTIFFGANLTNLYERLVY